MPAALTDLERKILDYMVHYLRAHTYQPSIREIGEEFDIKSTKTVSEYLGAIAEKGYLERDPSRSRGVRILGVDLSPQTISVPCFSTLPDDRTGFASDGIEAYYSLDRRMVGAKGCYFVRARGSEFEGVGILEGDLLLIEPTSLSAVREGDLVVVRKPDGVQLFRYARDGYRHLLRPAVADSPAISVDTPEQMEIVGRGSGVFRRFRESMVPVSPTAH
jgi:repressor LexA